MATLFGRLGAVSGIFFRILRFFTSTMSSVSVDSLVRYKRLPSGAAATPWITSASGISATIRSVVGSIRDTLSPAELVWTITVRPVWAVSGKARTAVNARRPIPRSTW